MSRRGSRPRTIFIRILIPLLIVVVAQSAFLYISLTAGGVFERLSNNAIGILSDCTDRRAAYMRYDMLHHWSDLSEWALEIDGYVDEALASNGRTIEDIAWDHDMNGQIVESSAQALIRLLRRNRTTGVFLVLNGAGMAGEAGRDNYAGAYLRDNDPSTYSTDDRDLLLERGMPPLSRALKISLDSNWKACFAFEGGEAEQANDYFYRPLRAAQQGGNGGAANYGYWSAPFRLSGDVDMPVVTYSMPLIHESGEVYGVLGVEVSVNYIASMMEYDELSADKQGAYFLGVTKDGGQSYDAVAVNGPIYKVFYGDSATLLPDGESGTASVKIFSGTKRHESTLYGAIVPLNLYTLNTPFERESWALIGLQEKQTLFHFAEGIQNMLYAAILWTMVLGALLAMPIGRSVARPITRLVGQLRQSAPDKVLSLDRTGFYEVDLLSESIETMRSEVVDTASRISTIMKQANVSLGVLEIRAGNDSVFLSGELIHILGLKSEGDRIVSCKEWGNILNVISPHLYDEKEQLYRLPTEGGVRWVRFTFVRERANTFGAALDVTREMEEKLKIETERDYDALTGVYNRRAFDREAEAALACPRTKVAALLMLDLDNLKYINDCYGHDSGDVYLRAFTQRMTQSTSKRSLIARRSGDEFYALFLGEGSKEELRRDVDHMWRSILEGSVTLPCGKEFKIRASGGLSWYPSDSDALTELIHFADFAMYKIKNTVKGNMQEFDPVSYRADSILLSGQEALNRLIDERLVSYALQPIVSAADGSIFGFELLMRPAVRELPGPYDVLRLASAHKKLSHIERLTWFEGLKAVDRVLSENEGLAGKRFFLNTIANQMISESDERALAARYPEAFAALVLEMTEGEQNDAEMTAHKVKFVRESGGLIAIDDYGTGYNSEAALMLIDADFVKADVSFVRGIDSDARRVSLIRNLISYAHERGIRVIAEGIETEAELRTLRALGVDYFQGYFLARPSFEIAKVSEEAARILWDAQWENSI